LSVFKPQQVQLLQVWRHGSLHTHVQLIQMPTAHVPSMHDELM